MTDEARRFCAEDAFTARSNLRDHELDECHRRFCQDSDRLFVPDEKTFVKFMTIGEEAKFCRCAEELERCMASWQSARHTMTVVYIGQEYSMGKLLISEKAMRALLGHLQLVFPFFSILHEFGERIERPSESRGSCQEQSFPESKSFALCYLVKLIEEHGRDFEESPWSIRQTGVYHQRDYISGKDFFIILNPTHSFQWHWRQATQYDKATPNAEDLHSLLLSCAASKWSLYVDGFEDSFEALRTKTHLSRVQPNKQTNPNDLQYDDVQDIQVMRDKFHRLNYLLESNTIICEKVESKIIHRPWEESRSTGQMFQEPGKSFGTYSNELRWQRRRVQTLLGRLDAVAGLMQSILALRGLKTLDSNGEISIELARLARADNQLMLDLSVEAHRDARTLKTITILTMIYLPASFVSQLLSMGYISITRRGASIVFHLDGELALFGVLTAILLLATFAAWWWAERRHPSCLKLSRLRLQRFKDEEASIASDCCGKHMTF